MAAGWPVPATEEAGIEFDRAAGEERAGGAWGGLREPALRQGEGGQSQEPFTSLSAAPCRFGGGRRAFLPHLLPTTVPRAAVSALPSEASRGRRLGRDRAAAMRRQRGVRLKNGGGEGDKAW